jgi:CSLREA domain-containing protein
VKTFYTFIILLTLAIGVNGATFVVNSTTDAQDATAGDGVCATAGAVCTLRAAITEANALAGADIITLPAGTYTSTLVGAENLNAGGDFDITSDITINGAGSGSTFVEANVAPGVATERVFHIRGAAAATTLVVTIDGVTVRNGRYASNTFGAGIRIDQGTNHNVTLSNLIVRDNLNGSSGGGISVSGATTPTVTISNSTITANGAGSAIAGTSANGAGFQINVAGGTYNITNTTISNNASNNAIVSSTASVFGGGLFIGGGTVTVTNSSINGNSVAVSGAGATGSAFAGGIYNQQATLNMTNSNVQNNTSTQFHAGIRTLAGTIAASTTLTNCTVSGNTANSTEGGGLINFATGTANSTTNVISSTVSGNSVPNGLAGGLENFASAAITGLAIMNVTNSTISGNTALNSAGGINTGATATTTYLYATIASNTATNNIGGIFQDTTGVTNLRSSIIADNSSAGASQDISGTITSQDYNHVENTSGGVFFARLGKNEISFLPAPNDVTGSDPLLGPLANNGGTTLTHLPAIASPVMNTIPSGTNDCGTTVTTSQNGNARPQQTGCEKGGAERLAPTAAGSLLKGRLLTSNGRGLSNSLVMLTNTRTGEVKSARSSGFGYFTFEDLPTGDLYILEVPSKRFRFNQQSFTLNGDLTDLVLTAQ